MGWRTKFIFLLIVYCAGFVTAVYCLAPTPEQGTRGSLGLAGMAGTIKSEELAKSVSSGIHKCVDLGQEAAAQLARRIQAQIGKAQSESANKPGS
ncbi:MAG TPA: hypothetical protein PK373_07945 [Sedimentisphaerales bacterium]|nr:hypothetical protein [Phycisphaerae bacterium]HON90695.1 hypothetical protein [Sedimentisphaerales bacterium]HQG49005.1 hypothetical protein [Sedimentisphaerales bacterium]